MQEQRADPASVKMLLQQRGHLRVLGEDEHRLTAGQDQVGQFVERGQLPGPAVQRSRLLQVLGRMVADLLQRGQQLEHQAGPLDTLGLLDRFHRLADHRLVQRDLLGGQRHEQVRLGLARKFRRDTRDLSSAAAAGRAG